MMLRAIWCSKRTSRPPGSEIEREPDGDRRGTFEECTRRAREGVWYQGGEKMAEARDGKLKDERVTTEKRRLSRIFTKIEPKAKKAVSELISNAAFISVTLQDLQEDINRDGTMTEYQNGENQWGTKKNPDVDTYNTMIKNYAGIIKQLTDLLPKELPKPKEDEFDKFLNAR